MVLVVKVIKQISSVWWQFFCVATLAGWGWFHSGFSASLSVFCGWLSWLLPMFYFSWRQRKIATERDRKRLFWLFWRAELTKWGIAALLIYLSLTVAGLSYPYFLGSFIVTVFYFAFKPLWGMRG